MLFITAFRRLNSTAAKACICTTARATGNAVSVSVNSDGSNNMGLLALLAGGAVVATGIRESENKTGCTAIAAVVGKKDFDAR